jgi:RNase P/RNase MRP subunit POP5
MVRLKHRFIIAQVFLQHRPKNTSNQGNHEKHIFEKERPITSFRILETIRQKVAELFGEMGIGKFGQQIVIKYYEHDHSKFVVIKVPREHQKNVHFCLSCITQIDEIPLIIRSLSVHSCTRTCTNKLSSLMKIYLEHHPSVAKEQGMEEQLVKSVETALVNE